MSSNDTKPGTTMRCRKALRAHIATAVANLDPDRRAEVAAAMERGDSRVMARFSDLDNPGSLTFAPQVLTSAGAGWTDVCVIPWDALPLKIAEVAQEWEAAKRARDLEAAAPAGQTPPEKREVQVQVQPARGSKNARTCENGVQVQ